MEQERIGRAKGGEIQAFEELLEPNIATGYRYATALLHDPSIAEDAVQEACMRAWRKIGQLRPDSAFLPWFLGIVGNQCREQMRKRWWGMIRIPDPRVLSAELPEDAVLRRAALREALGELSERERQVLILRLYLDLPWSDVASVAGVSEAGARTRYYRALQRLRFTRASEHVTT